MKKKNILRYLVTYLSHEFIRHPGTYKRISCRSLKKKVKITQYYS